MTRLVNARFLWRQRRFGVDRKRPTFTHRYQHLYPKMDLLPLITVINWLVVTVLGFLLLAEIVRPSPGGGDAAGRGIGLFFFYVAIGAFFVLLILNVLPFAATRYAAFALIVGPVLFVTLGSRVRKLYRRLKSALTPRKPLFPDRERDRLARAIELGKVNDLKKLLPSTPPDRLNEGGELLGFAVAEATRNYYRPAEKLDCVRLLLQHGARVDLADTAESPLALSPAASGFPDVLRLLLEHGANPNAEMIYLKRHILFEAADAYQNAEATVRVLLEHGANANVTTRFGSDPAISILAHTAQRGRWGVCLALLEHGADPNFSNRQGHSFKKYFDEASQGFSPDGYSTLEDFERLKAWVNR